jgi:hypothetical protein
VTHALSGVLFAALAVWSTYPLIGTMGAAIPGTGPGDNVVFLWNVWWFQNNPLAFWTDRLFFPLGTSLILHTHAAFPSSLAATVAGWLGPPTALNAIILAALAANGLATYALVWHLSRQWTASVAAGLVVAASPFVQLRLLGHFNLVHVWVLPVFALALLAHLARPSIGRAVALALALAAVAYTDYYYAVFAWGLGAALVVAEILSIRIERRRETPTTRRVRRLAAMLAAVPAGAIAFVLSTGGGDLPIAPGVEISIRSTRNPTALLMLLAGLWLAASWTVRASRRSPDPGAVMRSLALPLALCGLALLPLAVGAVSLVANGDYATQTVLWRSSPPGVDLATIVGNPTHLVAGPAVRRLYERFEIDVVEQTAYVSLVALLVVGTACGARRYDGRAVGWGLAAIAFGVVALGPFLRVAGADTGVLLPDALLRYMPIVSNARIPGRAIVVVQLCLAVLCGLALAQLRSPLARMATVAALALELMPAPAPVYPLPAPDAIDAALRESSEPGAVVELPTGLRDGFGERGRLDHRALVRQIAHGRPLVGGFVARLSPRIARAHERMPLLAWFLDLSAGVEHDARRVQPPPGGAARRARELGIGFVVVNEDVLPHASEIGHALVTEGFSPILRDGPRVLYSSAPDGGR